MKFPTDVPVKIHVTHETATIIPSHRSVQFDDQTAMEAVKHQNGHQPVQRAVPHPEMEEIERNNNFAIIFLFNIFQCERKQFFFSKLTELFNNVQHTRCLKLFSNFVLNFFLSY